MGKRVLLVEDDGDIAETVGMFLRADGLEVVHITTLPEATQAATSQTWDLLILDIDLPPYPRGGITLCEQLRKEENWVPVLFLSGYDDKAEVALQFGGDVFISKKPFRGPHLQKQISAILRRAEVVRPRQGVQDQEVRFPTCSVNRFTGIITPPAKKNLTPTERDLLNYLYEHADQVMETRQILDSVWGDDHFSPAALPRMVSTLRDKVGLAHDSQEFIVTIPGRGYMWRPPQRACP